MIRLRPSAVIPLALTALLRPAPIQGAAGTTAGEFLGLIHGARSLAMGNAFTGVADGAESLPWNPAGLVSVNHHEVDLSYGSLYEGFDYGSVVYAGPSRRNGGFAFSLSYFTSGAIPKTEASSRGLFLGDAGSFDVTGRTMAFSFAQEHWDFFSWGVTAKSVGESIDQDTDSDTTLDAGVRLDLPLGLRLGAASLNNGGSLQMGAEASKAALPSTTRAGASLRMLNKNRFILAADYSKVDKQEAQWTYGAELSLGMATTGEDGRLRRSALALRGGFRPKADDVFSDASAVTFGIGVGIKRYALDYAFTSYGDLGDTHRVTLNFRFFSGARLRDDQQDEDNWSSDDGWRSGSEGDRDDERENKWIEKDIDWKE